MGVEPRVCEHCEAVLNPDDRFCGACGRPVPELPDTEPTQTPRPTPAPDLAPPKPNAPNRRLIAVGALVMLLILALFAFRPKTPKPMVPIDEPEAAPANPAPAPVAEPAERAGSENPAPADAELVGIWADPDAPDNGYIEIRSVGGKLAATAHNEGAAAQPIEIESASGRKASGRIADAQGRPVPIAMELMEGSGQLLVTTGATEEDTATTTLSRVDKPPRRDSSRPQAEVAAPPKNAAEALLMVRARPEVAQFVNDVRLRGRQAHIRLVSENDAGYLVQVFEPMTDASGATEAKTFGYYMVSKSTGEVKAQF